MSQENTPYHKQFVKLLCLSIVIFFVFKIILPERLFPEQLAANNNIVVDSMMIKAMADSKIEDTNTVDTVVKTKDNNIANTDILPKNSYTEVQSMNLPAGVFDPSIGKEGYVNLSRFYSKLQNLEENPNATVRIGYYGDSMNDGDFIVQDIRSILQGKYGGKGVGFVAITSLSANSRGSVRHDYSKNWLTLSSVKTSKSSRPFGVDGQVFFANSDNCWVKYAAQGQLHSESLFRPTLFYGSAKNDTATVLVKIKNKEKLIYNLKPKNVLNTQLLGNSAQALEIEFDKADSIPIYGLNFDNGKGIHIDNFSIRGNSGLPLSILNTRLMNAFDRVLKYDLIILQYGTNVLGSKNQSFGWYEKSMTRVVKNLRTCFPNADILIISTADKASKIDGNLQTDPAVTQLAIAQRNYARITNSGYINLYDLMGGEGSMVEWVERKEANKDYTHFNPVGSRKIGRLISEELMKGFTKYKKGDLENLIEIIDED